jgi:outer membrane protein assembly factor BamB
MLLSAALLVAATACNDVTGREGSPPVSVEWKVPLAGVDRGLHAPATDGKRLFALGGGLFAYDLGSGSVAWRAGYARYMPRSVSESSGRVFLAETVVLAFDGASGRELWRSQVDSAADFAWSAADERSVYVGTRSHRVYAIDAQNGSHRWSVDVGPGWRYGGAISGLSASGDTVYAAAEQPYAANGYLATGWLFAINRNTGGILWSYQNGRGDDLRNFITAPTVAGRLLLASDRKGNAVVAVDRFTGREVWRVRGEPGYIGFTDPPVVVNDTVYAASGDTHVYAIDLPTGRVHWRTPTPGANNAFAVCGEYVLANYQGLAVLDRHTGRIVASMFGTNEEFLTSGFAVAGNKAFVLGNKAAYALSCK